MSHTYMCTYKCFIPTHAMEPLMFCCHSSYVHILPALQSQPRFTDREKLKATATVHCPFFFLWWHHCEWMDSWLMQGTTQGTDRPGVVCFFLEGHCFPSASKASCGSEDKPRWGCPDTLVQLSTQLTSLLLTLCTTLCGVHWSSLPLGHHESRLQTVVRTDRHAHYIYSCSNACPHFLVGFFWKTQIQRRKCI